MPSLHLNFCCTSSGSSSFIHRPDLMTIIKQLMMNPLLIAKMTWLILEAMSVDKNKKTKNGIPIDHSQHNRSTVPETGIKPNAKLKQLALLFKKSTASSHQLLSLSVHCRQKEN